MAARGLGRTLIATGTIVLLFVAYQLWGTGIQEARAQDRLARTFARETQESAPTIGTVDDLGPETPPGGAVALLRIPKIGVDKVVVEGVAVADLKKGPGHYPGTPLPGQVGNAAIAGHRTTYGQPFYRLDELAVDDEIQVVTAQGRFRYEVTGNRVVKPSEVSVLEPTLGATLTLTTCHPRYSSRQRLVVTALLTEEPAPTPTTVTPPRGSPTTTPPLLDVAGLSGDRASAWPTVRWALLAAAVALAIWLLGRAWRRWPVYLLGAPVFLVVLFVCFENVSRLLPANI